ncbi:hypothetical protein TNCV_3213451 [Trichonephila clavipes]|nr:hypothetical protein TNCV_3213451 [Trichonephila clavipes]
MQFLNFERKYEAAVVTDDISCLSSLNCLVRPAQMIEARLFCEEEESISKCSLSEEDSMGILKEKPLTHIKIMFDPSPFVNPTPLAYADTSRDVLPRGGTSQNVFVPMRKQGTYIKFDYDPNPANLQRHFSY